MSEQVGTRRYNRTWLTIRSALFWLWMIINTLVMGAPVLITSVFSFHKAYWLIMWWVRGNIYGLKLICGIGWQVDGRENIPDHATIVMSKHQSTWETFFIAMLVPKPVYVAKQSLALIPIFGWALYTMKFILIDRKSGRSAVKQMVTQTRERIANGGSVVIFPEGTRVKVGAEPNYRIGGALVAEQTGIEILPIAVNSGEFWPRMSFIKWPGDITVSIGPVIQPEGKTAAMILEETQDWIEGRMQEITVKDRFPY